LDEATEDFLSAHARYEDGQALVDASALAQTPREIGLRVLAFLLMRVAGMSYRPRFVRLEALLDAVLSGKFAARTLSGCRVGMAPKALSVFGQQTLLIARENRRKPKLEREGARGKNLAASRRPKLGSSDTFRDAE